RWTIHSLLEILAPALLPFMGLSLFALFTQRKDSRTAYFAYAVFACVVIYIIGPRIGILDIRFVPFFQLLLAVFGATLVAESFKEFKLFVILPLIFFLIVAIWTDRNATYIRGWIGWNYNGYEMKTTWPVFKGINDFLKTNGAGRVEWEHAPADEALGSIRSSETLPYFAGRETLEGIHMLGTPTAPFVFYLESETSFQSCNPIQDYFYSTLDLKRGIDHFKLFNVSQFVVRSGEVKKAIRSFPEFKLEKSVGNYNIYRLQSNNEGYVVPLKNKPVLFLAKDWRDIAYQWFARPELKDVFLVFKPRADEYDRKIFNQTVSSLDQVKPQAYPPKNISINSVIHNEAIEIETSQIGRPLLIKVSYHPNWKVSGADQVYMVSPSFMMVIPKEHKVRLSFEPGFPSRAGLLLSLLGLVAAFSSPLWLKKIKLGPQRESGLDWKYLAGGALIIILLVSAAEVALPSADTVLKKAREQFDRGEMAGARSSFARVIKMAKPSSGPRCEAKLFYATTFVRENNFKEGAAQLAAFLKEYPTSFWSPQAYFDLAYCEVNLGNKAQAGQIYKKIINDFPTTSWAKYSQERLK
ncbi:MAG: 6-pyruvoyl-tetrahydropterin synthase-related protein, partial [Candidatus Margulisbacteria bacterium]|nr:6-pyruvoyl-tetrahydropterin synthase-related protein [Candidatus Margulisiibacteriota bacterium]